MELIFVDLKFHLRVKLLIMHIMMRLLNTKILGLIQLQQRLQNYGELLMTKRMNLGDLGI